DPLPDETPAEGRDRDGLARARLQSHASDEYHRRSTAPGGDEGIVALVCCLHPQCTGGGRPGAQSGACQEREKPPTVRSNENGQARPNRDHQASSSTFLHDQDPNRRLAGGKFRTAASPASILVDAICWPGIGWGRGCISMG